MDHEVHVVQQHPLRLLIALDMSGPQPGAGESLLYFIRDGLNLPRVATGADDEIIGEAAGRLVQLEHGEVFGFLFLGGGHGIGDLPLQFSFLRHETSARPLRWIDHGDTEVRRNYGERGMKTGARLFPVAYLDHLSSRWGCTPGTRRGLLV